MSANPVIPKIFEDITVGQTYKFKIKNEEKIITANICGIGMNPLYMLGVNPTPDFWIDVETNEGEELSIELKDIDETSFVCVKTKNENTGYTLKYLLNRNKK